MLVIKVLSKLLPKALLALLIYMPFGVLVADPIIVPTPKADTQGSGQSDQYQNNQMMEKCKVVDKDGNGLIKAYMADSGLNLEGDANAWIWVPYGQCAKINAGDYSGITPDILAKINSSNVQTAPTLGD